MTRSLRWYLTSNGFYLIPGGIQQVLFPWLVAVFLAETPERLGFAQMASQIPMVLLILWGGLLGDRIDQRKLLIGLQLLMIVPLIGMASLLSTGDVYYELLLGWAIIGATLGAFAQPARDALLNRVAGTDIQRVVTLAVGIQFGIQILGFIIGSGAEVFGPAPLLLVQAFCMFCASVATARIPKLPPIEQTPRRHPLKEIADGLAHVYRSDIMRPATILTAAVGIFFAGSYMVILPLMVRDIYQGGATGIAMAFGANMLGTVTTISFIMRRGGLDYPGRALLVVGTFSSVILGLLHFDLPIWGFYGVIYFWGMCGGISMTMSRAIVQEAAPASHRARIMSVYSLGMIGGIPIGSLVLGWSVGQWGAQNAVLIPAVGMLAVLALLAATSKLWDIKRQPTVTTGE
jgi:MFS family permease